jgi:hypothetical protein
LPKKITKLTLAPGLAGVPEAVDGDQLDVGHDLANVDRFVGLEPLGEEDLGPML